MFCAYKSQDDDEPVAHQCEKILKDAEQVVVIDDGADKVYDGRDVRPTIPWYSLPELAKDLKIEAC